MKHRLLLSLLFFSFSLLAHGATTRTWSGFGSTGNWNTATNWVGNAVLVAGDDLVFPSGAPRLTTTNNLVAGTAFKTITVTGSNYVFNGNSVTLSVGLTNNAPAGTTNTFLFGVALSADTAFQCAANSTLILGIIAGGANNITFDSGGSILANGGISGSSSLRQNG